MEEEKKRNVLLGVFVVTATAFLVGALYFIGSKRNMFSSNIRISTFFQNVNGLMVGNNVRYAGINVGTVESITIVNDSAVHVMMIIDRGTRSFIKKNSITTIGTEGLMGNKLVNIDPIQGKSAIIQNHDTLNSVRPIEMDDMVRTLNSTNENVRNITHNLKHITERINGKNSLWNLLSDTVLPENIKVAFSNLRVMTAHGTQISGTLKEFSGQFDPAKKNFAGLFSDTVAALKIRKSVVYLDRITDTVSGVSNGLSNLVQNLQNGKGALGKALTDTTLYHRLINTVDQTNKAAVKLDENMIAVRASWPFKKYFRSQKK